MDSPTYIKNAIRTESVPASVEINQLFLHSSFELLIQAAKVADLLKRKIFYGTSIDAGKVREVAGMAANMAGFMAMLASDNFTNDKVDAEGLAAFDLPDELKGINLANLDVRLLHAGLGIFSESGELIEALQKAYETGTLDKVNFGEEIGDIEWYQAIGFDATGVTEASCREKNIAKLQKRYPEKFDAVAAVNRDTVAERVILEGGDTAHLLSSPANALHLAKSIEQLNAGQVVSRPLIGG